MLRILLTSATLVLSGCMSSLPVITQSTVDCGVPPAPDSLSLFKVSPYILVVGKEAHSCTSIKDYKYAARNLSKILANLKQKNALIDHYQECVEIHSRNPPKE